MGLIQSSRQSSGGGGGGLTISGFSIEEFEQSTNFVSGGVVLTLAQTPVTPTAVVVDWNGQRLLYGLTYTVSGNSVTILFADPYVEDSEDTLYFQVSYPY